MDINWPVEIFRVVVTGSAAAASSYFWNAHQTAKNDHLSADRNLFSKLVESLPQEWIQDFVLGHDFDWSFWYKDIERFDSFWLSFSVPMNSFHDSRLQSILGRLVALAKEFRNVLDQSIFELEEGRFKVYPEDITEAGLVTKNSDRRELAVKRLNSILEAFGLNHSELLRTAKKRLRV